MSFAGLKCSYNYILFAARSVLVDFSHPLGSVGSHSINESLSNLFILLNHLQGPPRVPLLSIFALGNFPEVIK